MNDAPWTVDVRDLIAVAVAFAGALGYAWASIVCGARLALGSGAAVRVAESSGISDALAPGSRSWAAVELVRGLALSAAVLAMVGGPFRGHLLAVGIATAVLVTGLGRVLQALISPRWPETILAVSALPIRLVDWVFGAPLTPLARAYDRFLGTRRTRLAEASDEGREEQLLDYIRDAEQEGILEEEESALWREVVDASDVMVREVMTPRTEIAAIGAHEDLAAAVEKFTQSRHSRLLVHGGNLDKVVGLLPVRDLMGHLTAADDGTRVGQLMRKVKTVPATKRVLELLRELQQERQQIAVVIDEYGGTAGLVSIEDLLEEIVGEIRDEHELDEEPVRPAGEGVWLVDGLVPIDDLAELLGTDIPADDVETIGGLIFSRLGRLPKVGDRIEAISGLTLEVVRLRGRRIETVRVKTDRSRAVEKES